MLSVNYRWIMVHYQKQLCGVFHYVVLSVLREVTLAHIGCGRLHVTENVFPDVYNPMVDECTSCNVVKIDIQKFVWAHIASEIATFGTDCRFSMTTHTSIASRCNAITSGSWQRNTTGLRKTRRHFSYIDQRITLLSTTATVSKCQYGRICQSFSARIREICKSVGCDPKEERASLPRTSGLQCTTFHL